MCGIISYTGNDGATNRLLTGLSNLEYRGYDSAGIAVQNGSGLEICKRSGEVNKLKRSIDVQKLKGSVGIGHTRWSTHGPPTDSNAHPHIDCTGNTAVVHNGIIENHDALRKRLEEEGHRFVSDTDTEVIPHLFESYLNTGVDALTAFSHTIDELKGSYAIVVSTTNSNKLLASRQGSPLVLGLGNDGNFIASDVPAFLEFVDDAVYLEDGEVIEVTPGGYTISDPSGARIHRTPQSITWDIEDAAKGGFKHYMLKEIQEQPTAVKRSISGRISEDFSSIDLENFPPREFSDVTNVHFVACGTSYHAAQYASNLLNRAGVGANAYRAGEYAIEPVPIDSRTIVIGVTQSGETADTLESLRVAIQRGGGTCAVTNVIGSTAARESDKTMYIHAGPEIGVAATKTFSSQVVCLILLIERMVRDITGSPPAGSAARLEALTHLSPAIENVLRTSTAADIAEKYRGKSAFFFIGRGLAYPVASEGALKFKEITYEHAEGFAAGQLKHGPLALVTENTPVFAIFNGYHDEKTRSNVQEVKARGAPVIAISPESTDGLIDLVDDYLSIPEVHPDIAGLLGNVQLQLLSYHVANKLGRSIDKPRNLAKSVTVE